METKRIDRLWTALNKGQLLPARAADVFDVLAARNAERQAQLEGHNRLVLAERRAC